MSWKVTVMVIHHRISGSSLLGGCSPCWVYVFAAEPLTDQWYLHNLYLLPRDAVTAALHLLDKDFQLTEQRATDDIQRETTISVGLHKAVGNAVNSI